jgi:hypothetical protein
MWGSPRPPKTVNAGRAILDDAWAKRVGSKLHATHMRDRPVSNASAGYSHTQTPRTIRREQRENRTSGNTVYRGSCSQANQCTSIQGFLERTTRNEEYVIVPEGNILTLAT